ncbi:hypothetical protein DKG74_11135 [Zavarzinia aquatilis]|uniref:Tetratricopeptide repeat protein n=2 Tax=Zavarzinia aquatilis TaxID=2211142 RepID=A0A317E765_9PROT|nr:hypothetical protein DKG74_11135 [Zavarzinia aquatilis]
MSKEQQMVMFWPTIEGLDAALDHGRSSKDFTAALKICEEHCRKHPQDAVGFAARSRVFTYMRMPARALADLDLSMALQGYDFVSDFAQRAALQMALERWPDAIQSWLTAISMDEEGWFETYANLQLADCYIAIGDLDAAERECAKASPTPPLPACRPGRLYVSAAILLEDITRLRGGATQG